MDVAAIEPGRDFRKAIDQNVADCSLLLAMIGQGWLEAKDSGGQRRLDDANDFVRIELASALRRDIPVVPVLVQGAKMPRVEELPEDLKELAYRNAVELTHARWRSDVQVLLQALGPYLDEAEGGAGKVPGEAPPIARGAAAADAPVAAETLERVRRELARYIGPIAEVVVKRAAKRGLSLEELCGAVAGEIDGEGDRTQFLRSCASPVDGLSR